MNEKFFEAVKSGKKKRSAGRELEATVNTKNTKIYYITTDNIEALRPLISSQTVEAVDDDEYTGLHWAAENGTFLHWHIQKACFLLHRIVFVIKLDYPQSVVERWTEKNLWVY